MKKFTPIIIYLTGFITFLLMGKYRVTGYAAGLILLNVTFFLWYFVRSIINAVKCKFKCLKAYVLLLMSPTFLIVFLKLDFIYYHFYYHLIYFTVFLILLLLLYENNRSYIKGTKIILFATLLNICTLSLNDYIIFKFWNNNKISWSEESFNWEDYKQLVPDDSYDVGAITTNGLQWKISKVNNTPSVVVIGFMKPSESWVKENYKTNKQLKHEQLYLDICELHARKIRKIFNENKYGIDANGSYTVLKSVTDSITYYKIYNNSDAESVIRKIMDDKDEMNNIYMRATEHGQNKEKQLEWESMIKAKLKELEAYKR